MRAQGTSAPAGRPAAAPDYARPRRHTRRMGPPANAGYREPTTAAVVVMATAIRNPTRSNRPRCGLAARPIQRITAETSADVTMSRLMRRTLTAAAAAYGPGSGY